MRDVMVTVSGGSGEARRLEADTRQLMADLRALKTLSVRPGEAPAEPGSKSTTAQQVGALVISGVFSAATLGAVRDVVIAFVERAKARTVTVKVGDREVTLSGASRDDLAAVTAQLETILTEEPTP